MGVGVPFGPVATEWVRAAIRTTPLATSPQSVVIVSVVPRHFLAYAEASLGVSQPWYSR